eukprot:gene7730-1227_t
MPNNVRGGLRKALQKVAEPPGEADPAHAAATAAAAPAAAPPPKRPRHEAAPPAAAELADVPRTPPAPPPGAVARGPSGIRNVGNTCYLATATQCLLSLHPVRHALRACQPQVKAAAAAAAA